MRKKMRTENPANTAICCEKLYAHSLSDLGKGPKRLPVTLARFEQRSRGMFEATVFDEGEKFFAVFRGDKSTFDTRNEAIIFACEYAEKEEHKIARIFSCGDSSAVSVGRNYIICKLNTRGDLFDLFVFLRAKEGK